MYKALFNLLFILFSISIIAKENIEDIKVDVLAKTTKSWDAEELPSYGQGKAEITILKVVIPPNRQVPLHKHPMISAGVILKGKLTVIKEGTPEQVIYIKTGDALVDTVNTWHYGRNDGNESVELIIFYAGTVNTPLSIQKIK